jgi:NAD(P)-dependent dehydrogenase (short-subunit alcohol dehydrogenase family)
MTVAARGTPEQPSFSLKGRLAVVTGASEGIGRSLALAFAGAGARLALVSRAPERLAELVASIEALRAEAETYRADLCALADVEGLARAVTARQGAAGILVNSAGAPLTKPAFDVTEAEWDLVMDTGLKGMFFACLAFGRIMAERGYGKIVNLASTYSESVASGKSVYAIAKAGVAHLTRALALEWAPLGVRVNALAPTLTVTPTRQAVLANRERMQAILARIPMGRYAEPSDLVGAGLFLASQASDFVTGQTLFVDGGWHAAR